VPLVLNIGTVGLSGFYASTLLQGRVDITSSVLQSLSGFRDLSDAMGAFLSHATPQKRDIVKQKITVNDLC